MKLLLHDAGMPGRELTAGRTLHHPNIIPIYDLVEEDGRSGVTMQLALGGNLRAKLAKGPMPLAVCRPIWMDILNALQHAHQHSVIHRDVKPENIVFDSDGTAKLTDFGHAWFLEPGSSEHTIVGAGTPAYMAPEKESTRRSDVYSFGVVAHEMLAGGLPETTPLPPSVPWLTRRWIRKCIQRNPNARFASATEVIRAIHGPMLLRPVPAVATMTALTLMAGLGFSTIWWNPLSTAPEAALKGRPTLAVFFKGVTGDGFIQSLKQTGQFEVVERAELDRALAELQLSDDGAVSLETAQHAGRILGAKYLLFGQVQATPRKTGMSARLVETESLRVIKTDVLEGGPDASEVEMARNLASRFHR